MLKAIWPIRLQGTVYGSRDTISKRAVRAFIAGAGEIDGEGWNVGIRERPADEPARRQRRDAPCIDGLQ